MKSLIRLVLLASLIVSCSAAFAQPQLQELDVTAIAGPGWTICAQGEHVAVFGQLGLWFFQWDSVNTTLTLSGTLQIPNDIDEMKFHPFLPLLYVLDTEYNLYFVDLTEPQMPNKFDLSHIAEYNTTSFDLDSTTLYLLFYGLFVTLNNENPRNPALLTSAQIGNYGFSMIIDQQYLHGSGGWPDSYRYALYDIADPSNLEKLYVNPELEFCRLESVGGGHITLSDCYNLLLLYYDYPTVWGLVTYENMRNPSQCTPDGNVYANCDDSQLYFLDGDDWTLLGTTNVVGGFNVVENTLFGLTTAGTADVYYVDPPICSLRTSYEYDIEEVQFISVDSNLVAVSGHGTHNVVLYDCSVPTNLQKIAEIQLSGVTKELLINGDYLYVTFNVASHDTIAIYDISDPTNPAITGVQYFTLPTSSLVGYMLCRDDFLYISGDYSKFVYDVSEPAYPVLLESYVDANNCVEMHFIGDYLATNNNDFVELYDADGTLTYLSTIDPISSHAYFVAGKGDTLITGGHYTFDIYSIADPYNPQWLTTVDLPGINPKVYCANFDGVLLYANLKGFPIYSQYNYSLAAFYAAPGTPSVRLVDYIQTKEYQPYVEIELENDIIFAAQGSCLGVYRFNAASLVGIITTSPMPASLPQKLTLTTHPNPTNGNLLWTFDLPAPGSVDLEMYNLQGALVGQHSSGYFQAGTHTLTWFPDNLSSGIYIARLKAGEHSAQQKVVYLK
jgi:hypothetical protein